MLTVEALIYPPGQAGFRLSFGVLGSGRLSGAAVENGFRVSGGVLGTTRLATRTTAIQTGKAFVLGKSKLTTDQTLSPAGAVREWVDVSAGLARLKARRGLDRDGVRLKAATGLATLTYRADAGGDPGRYPGLTEGVRVRISDSVLGVLFTGRLHGVTRSPVDKMTDRAWLTWTIADSVRDRATTRVGPLGSILDTTALRAAQIDPTINHTPAPSGPAAFVRHSRAATVATQADHLDTLAASCLGYWFLDRNDAPQFVEATRTAAATVTLGDDQADYTDAGLQWGAGALVNQLTIKNHTTSDGASTTDITTETSYSEPTSVASIGVRAAEIDTTISPAYVSAIAGLYLGLYVAPRPLIVDHLTYRKPPVHHEIGEAWDITSSGRRARVRLAGIEYDVAPDITKPDGERWTTRYQFAERLTNG